MSGTWGNSGQRAKFGAQKFGGAGGALGKAGGVKAQLASDGNKGSRQKRI